MRFLLTSGSLPFPLEKTFHLAKAAGFDGINLMISEAFRDQKEVSLIRPLQEILPIDSVHVPFIPLWGWGNQVEKIKRTVQLAIKTGIPLVNFHPPGWLLLEVGFCIWFLGIKDFQKEVGQDRVMVSIENMPHLARYGCDPHLLADTNGLSRFLRDRNLFLSFDTSHMGTKNADLLKDFSILYDTGKIKQVQYGDYDNNGREHLIPGNGTLPLETLLNRLTKEQYTEGLCVETMPEEFPKDEGQCVERLNRILCEIKENIRDRSHHVNNL